MVTEQFNKKATSDDWYSLTYQSNDVLNEATHNHIKILIAKILVEQMKIKDIHSYVHGSIVFSINTNNPLTKFDEIIKALNKPFSDHVPKLLLILNLVAKDLANPPKRYMYVEGDSDMDSRFKTSIIEFYPPKAGTKHFVAKED